MTEPVTVENAQGFIREALEAFVRDPADSPFQEGYLEALYVVGAEALGMTFDRVPKPVRPAPRLRLVRSEDD